MGLAFIPGYNAYDLAKSYAATYSAEEQKALKIQFHCGTTCFNYVNSAGHVLIFSRVTPFRWLPMLTPAPCPHSR